MFQQGRFFGRRSRANLLGSGSAGLGDNAARREPYPRTVPTASTIEQPESDKALSAAAVAAALGARAGAFSVDVRQTCGSSNDELIGLAEAGATHRTVLACDLQTAGRGRRGRDWIAAPQGSLTFSLLWRFPPASASPPGLSLAIGVAVARVLEAAGAPGIALKWPNDILLGGRKLAGILVDLLPAQEAAPAAVIGIGLNVTLPPDFPHDQFDAADLAAVLPQPPSRNLLLAQLLIELDGALTIFGRSGFTAFRESWLARHALQDARVRLSGERETVEGICRGVDQDGALLLETPAGLRRIISGDVSLRSDADH